MGSKLQIYYQFKLHYKSKPFAEEIVAYEHTVPNLCYFQ